MKLLSRIEEIILLSIWKLRDDAYGLTIHREVSRATGKEWLVGAIYAPLSRLLKNGYVRIVPGDPGADRGERRRIYYTLTRRGLSALAEVRKVNSRIWEGVPALNGEKA